MAEKEKVDQIENEENLSSENISLEDNKDELSSSEQLDNSKEEKNEQSSETNFSKQSELENKTQVGQIEGVEDSKKIEDDQESKKKKSHKKNRSQRKAKIDKEKTLAVTSAPDAPEEVQQVLVSVSDEYLRKKKRKKIITLSSILSIVFILSIAIITLACVNINLKPFFIEPPSSYTIVIDGSERATLTMTDDEYNEFTEIFEKSMQINTLQALFTGRLDGYKIKEGSPRKGMFYTNETKSDLNSSLVSTLGSNYVRMRYSVEQNLFKSNGNYQYSSFDTNKKLCYIDIVFPLSTENKDSDVTLYFGTYAQSSSKDTSAYISTITITANTYALYDYIVNG